MGEWCPLPIINISVVDPGFLRRRMGTQTYYFVANISPVSAHNGSSFADKLRGNNHLSKKKSILEQVQRSFRRRSTVLKCHGG